MDRRNVKGFQQFEKLMQNMVAQDLFVIVAAAQKKALKPMQVTASRMYAEHKGTWDGKQTEAQKSWRWAGGYTSGWTGKKVKGKRDVVHPQGESRAIIAMNFLKNRPKPKLVNKKLSIFSQIFGVSQNSWLIEFGRYKDPARAYNGWRIFRNVFNQLAFSTEGLLRHEMQQGFKRWENKIGKLLKAPA